MGICMVVGSWPHKPKLALCTHKATEAVWLPVQILGVLQQDGWGERKGNREGVRQQVSANAKPVGPLVLRAGWDLQRLSWPLVSSVEKLLRSSVEQSAGVGDKVLSDESCRVHSIYKAYWGPR